MEAKSSSKKSRAYESDDKKQTKEERRVEKLENLKVKIQKFQYAEPLTQEWMQQVNSLTFISNITFIEDRHRQESDTVTLQESAGKSGEGTLWDQDHDELAVRIIVELGKTNLLLRMLAECRELSNGEDQGPVEDFATSSSTPVGTLRMRMTSFENVSGLLLNFALKHVEAVQVTDLRILSQHCASVFRSCLTKNRPYHSSAIKEAQETFAMHYLQSVGRVLDDLDEDMVMRSWEEHRVVPYLIRHLHRNWDWYETADLMMGLEALAFCFNSDVFSTHPEVFLEDDEVKELLTGFSDLFLNTLTEGERAVRARLQPLLDVIDRTRRRMNTK